MGRFVRGLAVCVAVLVVAACGDPTKQEIINNAKNADTKTKLEAALGKPDTFTKLGPIEKWSYKASDGSVTFPIAGESVGPAVTGGPVND